MAIWCKVLPVDSIARLDLERRPRVPAPVFSHAALVVASFFAVAVAVAVVLFTFYESTPLTFSLLIIPPSGLEIGELGAPTLDAALTIVHPNHEAAHPPPAAAVNIPVIMVTVVARGCVIPLGA